MNITRTTSYPVLFIVFILSLFIATGCQRYGEQNAQLFIFGTGESPLFLAGTADPDNPLSVQVHGDHFVPSAVESNGTLIAFLEAAISTSIAAIPISATSSGRTFRFEGGVPVPAATPAEATKTPCFSPRSP